MDTISGAGNSSVLRKYELVDDIFPQTLVYYKLKQVDFDGQFEDLGTKYILVEPLQAQDLSIYPNPVTNRIIRINGLTWYPGLSYMIYDENGCSIEQRLLSMSELSQGIKVSSTITQGIYFIQFFRKWNQ